MIPESHYTSNEKRILQAVAAVNNQISVMVQSLLKVDGAGRIKSTAGNIQRAKQMQKAIMKEMTQGAFKDEMNSLIGTFGKIPDYATEAFQEVRLLPEFGQADDEMVRIMANDTLNEVSAMATQWAGNINSAVYAGAIAGTPRKELLKQAEQLLIGHSDVRGRPMVNYVQTIVNTRIAELDTLMILRKGDELGIERWRYTGSTIRDSREWCVDHAGKIFTKEEIEEWRDKKWNGKKAGDPFVTRGGWNCRHGFSPVLVEAEVKPKEPAQKKPVKKPVKKPAADSRPIPNIDFGYKGKYNKHVKGLRPDALRVIDALPQPNEIVSGKGVYYTNARRVSAPLKSTRTFLHEYGHFIDNHLAGGWNFTSKTRLYDAAQADGKKLGLSWGGGLGGHDKVKRRMEVLEEFKAKWKTRTEVFFASGRRKGQLKHITQGAPETHRGFSDIIDSMSDGWFYDRLRMSGHGGRYYYGNVENQMTENFANLFQIWSQETHWEEATQLFPNLTKAFEQIMNEVIKNG